MSPLHTYLGAVRAPGPLAGDKKEDGWWMSLSFEQLREEFACLEEIECDNQAAIAEAGHHCAEKSTDGIWGLVNERDELKEECSSLRGELEKARERIETLFEVIAHGDEVHRTWLKNAIAKHFESGER